MPRIKRKQKQACDCFDCAEDAPKPESGAAVPQESLACVLFLCPADVTHAPLTQLPAVDRAVLLGSCGLLSLCGAHTGRLCRLGNGLHRL